MSITGNNEINNRRNYNGYAVFLRETVYDKYAKEFKKLNIEFPERLRSRELINEVIKNRKDLCDDGKPRALFVIAKKDWNNAFSEPDVHERMEELMKRGYKVFYYEAGTDLGFYQALKEVGRVKATDVLVLGGHGTQGSINLGATDSVFFSDDYIEDSDAFMMSQQRVYLNKGSTIILYSCSTGKGGKGADNIKELFQKSFPDSRVFAPTEDAHCFRPDFDDNNRIQYVYF